MPNLLNNLWKAINPSFKRRSTMKASPPMRIPSKTRINKTVRMKHKTERLAELRNRVAERKLRDLETTKEVSPRNRTLRSRRL
jgi:hypothetical protein